jgi:hypothetical protein
MNQQEHSHSIGALLLGAVVVIIIMVASMRTLNRFSLSRGEAIQPTDVSTSGENYYATPEVSGTPHVYILTARAISAITSTAIALTPFDTPTYPPTGTAEDMYVKPSGQKLGLDALNAWFGLIDGNRISLWAGSLGWDPDQGAIHIMVFGQRVSEKFLTPTRHGGVRVVSEQNNRLTLQAADGETFYFDVPALQFVASLTEVVPTATPLPTYTPVWYRDTQQPTANPYPLPTAPNTDAP